MRILATSDTHFPFDPTDWEECDVAILAGDLMYTGYPNEWQGIKESVAKIQARDMKLIIPGNHDFHIQNYEGIARAEMRREAGARIVVPSNPVVNLPNGMKMLAIPYVTGLQGWAYCVDEQWLYEWLKGWESVKPDIVVSHAPVYGILDAVRPYESTPVKREHLGGMATNKWFYELDRKPLVWISGHIHESYGHQVVDGCHFYNVAHCDKKYDQTNPPVIIDI